MKENENQNLEQTLTLTNRNTLTLNGVTKVHSVKDDLAQIETNLGSLQVIGKELQVAKLDLDKSELTLSGNISSLKYGEKNNGFFKKIFK